MAARDRIHGSPLFRHSLEINFTQGVLVVSLVESLSALGPWRSRMLSEDECRKILETYMKMSVLPDQQPSRRITEQLTDEELELAAMRSYA